MESLPGPNGQYQNLVKGSAPHDGAADLAHVLTHKLQLVHDIGGALTNIGQAHLQAEHRVSVRAHCAVLSDAVGLSFRGDGCLVSVACPWYSEVAPFICRRRFDRLGFFLLCEFHKHLVMLQSLAETDEGAHEFCGHEI